MSTYYKCECGKEFNNPQSFNGHKSNCIIHLKVVGKYDAYLKRRAAGYAHTRETTQKEAAERATYKEALWISEQHRCERCGKIMVVKFGSGRFCSRSCANSREQKPENNLKRRLTLRNNEKRKAALTKKRLEARDTYYQNPTHCAVCGKVLSYEYRHHQVCCRKCQNELSRRRTLKKCAEQGTNLCGKGRRGYYKGYYCQSSWELAYVIYQLEHGVEIVRNDKGFPYILDGVKRTYFPDFYLPTTEEYIEIKGYYNRKTLEKEKQFPKDKKLKILQKTEMAPILNYVVGKYGKDYTDLYDAGVPNTKNIV